MNTRWLALSGLLLVFVELSAARPPNIVYIMSDELAYFELSHMGNPHIQTPRIDQMAREGLRFTRALAAAPVCAPLRCALMTGKHMGHASVRANDGGTPLRADEPTIASILKPLGYATGGFGKWGAGGRGSTGVPEKHGFDVFFGYYDQVHAHSFYPPYLVRNSQEVVLPGNKGGRSGKTYSHYEIMREGLQFIRDNKDRPFFCYFPITPPHGMYDIPEDDPAMALYRDKQWPGEARNYAAMVTMVDRNVGEILDLLRELELEENTIVFFTGDNGGQDRFRTPERPRGFLYPNQNPRTGIAFRGGKGNLYEGGLRIPFLVRWPGRVQPGRVSDLLFYQVDVLPTLAELSGARAPADMDGLSILPEILGAEAVGRKQEQHEFLYWEYGSQTAVRKQDWKLIRRNANQPWELYDLSTDISEAHDVAARHPELVRELEAHAVASHEPVRAGTYADRSDHEKDRWAKWGDSKPGHATPRRLQRLPRKGRLDSKAMKVIRFSSANTGGGRHARFVLDDNPRTHWHSSFAPERLAHPHELVIDLGAERRVTGIQYLARQDDSWNGAFARCDVSVSNDPEAFGEPVAAATLKKVKAPQTIRFEAVKGRYVLVRALSEVNGEIFASAAEIGVLGTITGRDD